MIMHIQTSERFSFYKKFKSLYEMKPYLLLDLNIRCSLTRFIFGISDTSVHCIRYRSDVTAREMMCPFCKLSFEKKKRGHFVLV